MISDHLTSFALLLGGTSNNDCSDDDEEYALAWASLALVIVAILFVTVGVLAAEIHTRMKLRRTHAKLSRFSQLQSTIGS